MLSNVRIYLFNPNGCAPAIVPSSTATNPEFNPFYFFCTLVCAFLPYEPGKDDYEGIFRKVQGSM